MRSNYSEVISEREEGVVYDQWLHEAVETLLVEDEVLLLKDEEFLMDS